MVAEYINRLVKCGYTEANAVEICERYIEHGDWTGLNAIVRLCEALYCDDREYPKEDDYGLEY